MSFSLPEAGFHICEIALAGLDIDLIKGSVDWIRFYVSLAFPVSFESSVEILTNSISTGIPEADFFGKVVAQTIIGKRIAGIEEGEHVGVMHAGVKLIVGTGDDGDVKEIPGVDLVSAVDELMPAIIILLFCHMVLHLLDVDGRHP